MENEELEALVKKTLKLTEENNKILRRMQSAARWSRFFSLLWWALIIAVSWYAYYYYLQPYVEQLQGMYAQIQQTSHQAEGYGQQFIDFLNQVGKRP